MNNQLVITLVCLFACVVMFIINKPRMDVVGLMVIVILPMLGIVTIPEALAGFSDPNIILIAALFVIGEGLVRTGVASHLGDFFVKRANSSESQLLAILMAGTAGLGAFMSSTGVVAIFIPVVLRIAHRLNISPSRLMMPLCYAGLVSGMLTLIATAPNMVLDSALKRNGYQGFGFFSFTPLGILVLMLSIGYMLLTRNWLSPRKLEDDKLSGRKRTLQQFVNDYHLADRGHCLRIRAGSPLSGKLLKDSGLREHYRANVIAIQRGARFHSQLLRPTPTTELHVNDLLLVDVSLERSRLERYCDDLDVEALELNGRYFIDRAREIGMAEVLIPPESGLINKTIRETDFRNHNFLTVVGLQRGGKPVEKDFLDTKLKLADTLLVIGSWKFIRRLQQQQRDFIVLNIPAEIEAAVPASQKAPYALLSLAVMIGLMLFDVVPNVIAALAGCLLMGAFRCISINRAYQSIHWQSLIVIIGMMPFAVALQKTGGINLAVNWFLELVGGASVRVVLACLFAFTSLVGLFISNTATAVLMAPMAIAIAQKTGGSPHAFTATVLFASSSAFMAPVSSPVNMLVLSPGKYRFSDYVKIGVPFTIIVMVVTVVAVPWLFPPGK